MLAVIPARTGSRRLPGKNFREFPGGPLWRRACLQALRLSPVSQVVLSTDAPAHDLDLPAGVDCDARPPSLAGDEASSQDVARELWERLRPDVAGMIWLQPTSPGRRDADILGALEHWSSKTPVVTVAPGSGKFPRGRDGAGRLVRPGSGDPVCLNGAVYVVGPDQIRSGDWLSGAFAHVMPPEHSLDIDTPEDWEEAISRSDTPTEEPS